VRSRILKSSKASRGVSKRCCRSLTRAALVVIDPIMAFLGQGVLTCSDQSVRRALLPLAQLAEQHACVILMVRHLNKRGGRSLYRGGGSIGLVGACRSGWLLGDDPLQPGRRVLAEIKNNSAAPQPSLAYTVEKPTDGPPLLSWHGPVEWTADNLLARRIRVSAHDLPRERARKFLKHFLAEGPRTTREIWPAGQEADLSERTLRRAAEDLAIRS
jgi:AAA domain-containing protein